MKLLYVLTMPNVGSWNGRWTGETTLYARVRNLFHDKVKQKKLLETKDFYYNFGDGWGANIEISLVTEQEAKRVIKNSKGFCGYDWMIDSIEQFGEILNS